MLDLDFFVSKLNYGTYQWRFIPQNCHYYLLNQNAKKRSCTSINQVFKTIPNEAPIRNYNQKVKGANSLFLLELI